MHTLKIITAGIVLLVALIAIGHLTLGAGHRNLAVIAFLPLWLGLSLLNMYIGVSRMGYSVREELPILLLVLLLPSIIALALLFWN